jgi:hypothetical protein
LKAWDFHRAKRFVFAGAACGFLAWFIAFLAVGGEWFAMAITGLERSAARVSHLRFNSPCFDIRQPTGPRPSSRGGPKLKTQPVRGLPPNNQDHAATIPSEQLGWRSRLPRNDCGLYSGVGFGEDHLINI